MITFEELTMQIGSRLLFCDVTMTLSKAKYAIVGANGTGKSTLLEVIAKQQTPSSGKVFTTKNSTIGWLKQDQFLFENTPLVHILLQSQPALWNVIQEKELLLHKETFTDEDAYRIADLEELLQKEGGYTAEAKVCSLLAGLGINDALHYQPLKMLSGGYKLRVLLARALFEAPDILLLDEPTNYLDITSIQWLEDYLKTKFHGTLLLVSHDQDFLGSISTHVLDIDYGDIRLYPGSFSHFLEKKAAVDAQKRQDKKHTEARIAKMQVFIEKFRKSANRASQALSREKLLDRIEIPEIETSSRVYPHFQFQQKKPSGRTALEIKGLSKQFHDKIILQNINCTVHRGEKIAIIGQNGVGKSTFLKILVQEITQDNGTASWGHNTSISYFPQDPNALLKEDITLFDWLIDESQEHEQRVRQVLGQVLFSQDCVYKKVTTLSGGEKARLVLALMMLQKHNILILDEPTSHLDIEARTTLANALKNFEGTVLFVSHDRHFVGMVASRIIALAPKKCIDFLGGYEDYALSNPEYFKQ